MKKLIAAVSTAGLLAGGALADEAGNGAGAEAGEVRVTRIGAQASVAGPASFFTGQVRIDAPFSGSGGARVGGATVTFEPGARTAWHTHPLGQTLIVIAGAGPVQTIRAGDTVWIPPGVKHWHGAAPTTAMVTSPSRNPWTARWWTGWSRSAKPNMRYCRMPYWRSNEARSQGW